jgi:hypothetical protein
MKRPSFQFYPADWRNNSKLRRCSPAARGAWIDILCLLHDSDEYGILRWPLIEIIRASGASKKLTQELIKNDVFKGGDSGCEPYIYIPKSGNKFGEPVTLVDANGRHCWYSSRLVRDEYLRWRRGNATQFSSEYQPPNLSSNHSPIPPFGERQGDGSTSSSSSSSSKREREEKPKVPTGTSLSVDFEIPKEWESWALAQRQDLDLATCKAKFVIHMSAKGKKENDWFAAWKKWVFDEKGKGIPKNTAIDPDSRSAIESLGVSLGVGTWDEMKESWSAYKSKVRKAEKNAK